MAIRLQKEMAGLGSRTEDAGSGPRCVGSVMSRTAKKDASVSAPTTDEGVDSV